MKSVLAKTPDGTITLTIPVDVKDVEKAKDEALLHIVEETELPGFRKGKAPKNLVAEKVDKTHLQEDMLRLLIPKSYTKAVDEYKLKPIMNPKIHITKLEEGKDIEFTAQTCEMPEITLGEYKESVKSVTAKAKIALPGKEQPEVSFDDIVKALLEKARTTIPEILIESESDRLLSQMLDEIKSLGLSLDQYLASTHKTIDEIRKEYAERAKNDITIEFVLQKVAEEEKITIEPQEIDEAITKAPTPAEKENLEKNRYLLAAILRQQKTLDYLKNL